MHVQSVLLGLVLAAQGLAVPIENGAENTLVRRVTHYGDATYYNQNGQAGSCGQVHPDSDKIAALAPSWMPGMCGRKIQITNEGGGDSNPGKGNVVVVTVADTCPSCDADHLDLSQGAFKALTNGHLDPPGTFQISWNFCNADGQC